MIKQKGPKPSDLRFIEKDYFLLLLQNYFRIFNKELNLLGSMYVLSNKRYFLNECLVSVFTHLQCSWTHRAFLHTKYPMVEPAALLMPELPPILTNAKLISHFYSHFSAMQIRDGY